MSKVFDELLNLIREADEIAAPVPAGTEKAEEPGADACGEAKADLSDKVKDLDEPQGDALLPEEEKIDSVEGKVAIPAVEAPPAQPQAGDSSADLSNSSEVSAEELAADVDPDVAEIIRALGESDTLISEEEDEDSDEESEEKSDEEKKDDESASDGEFSDVDNISLSDDESKEVSAAASADEAPAADAEKKEEAALPGSEELSDEQKGCLRRLFDSCVAEGIQAKFPKLIKLVESKLNAKFKMISEQKEEALNQKVDHYLKYVVETWKEENKPQLHTAAQVKVAKKIFEGLKTMTEMFDIETIDVKAELIKESEKAKADLVAEYEVQIAKLKGESNKLVSENAKLVKELSVRDRAIVIEEASKGLPLTEVGGFKAAVANIKASDLQTFKENVTAVRASLDSKPKKTESIRATNESLALQGGLKGSKPSSQTEGDLIANLILDASENNK